MSRKKMTAAGPDPAEGMGKQAAQPATTAGAPVGRSAHTTANASTAGAPAVQLERRGDVLVLAGEGMEVKADFTSLTRRIAPNNLNGEMLVKASKLKKWDSAERPLLLDATAGLGEDSFLLAASGFRVVLFERDEVISALLEDGIRRAREDGKLAEIAERMELRRGDSIAGMQAWAAELESAATGSEVAANQNGLLRQPDVILLDPMFPERQKSGLVKKKFQLIHHLEQPCEEEDELLAAAMALKPLKIVIKRPLKGPFLGGIKPSYSLKGKAIRYDCLVLPR